MNEQQTRELAKQYRERAAIMEASVWVDGKCVNVETMHKKSLGNWFANVSPDWDFEHFEYRIIEPDDVMYFVMDEYGTRERSANLQIAIDAARRIPKSDGAANVLKVTTKPDGTKTAEFIEVGK